MSKRIEDATNSQSELSRTIPYVDPKKFNESDESQPCVLSEKRDVYSVSVLLWEISSGRPPFYNNGKPYDIDLAISISQGLRETPIPNTPEDYVKIYTGKYNLNSIIVYIQYCFN